ncbi:Triose-phosphate Transporter [Cladochytrium tenue]|nr:Triose-phosphate Transporter [Cladochytrium tenue]
MPPTTPPAPSSLAASLAALAPRAVAVVAFITLWYVRAVLPTHPGPHAFTTSTASRQRPRYGFSAALSILNKTLVGHDHGNFNAPLLMSCLHSVVHAAVSSATVVGCTPPHRRTRLTIPWRDYLRTYGPTALCTALDIGLSNSSLHYINLSFYTMIKSSVPVWVLVFAFLFRLERIRWKLVLIIFVICFGVAFSIVGEPKFHLYGFALVLVASMCSGLRWSLTQILLAPPSASHASYDPVESSLPLKPTPTSSPLAHKSPTFVSLSAPPDSRPSSPAPSPPSPSLRPSTTSSSPSPSPPSATAGPLATLHRLSPLMAALLALGSAITERGAFADAPPGFWDSPPAAARTLATIAAGGFLALVMTLAEFHLIAVTSVVTLSVVGIFKEVFMIAVSMAVFGDTLTPTAATGVAISIAGIAAYTLYRVNRTAAAAAAAVAPDHRSHPPTRD